MDRTPTQQRIDKWLWHARVVRTRSLAAALVTGGHVRINRERITKPGHAVRAGDVVTAVVERRVRVLRVEGFAERRGPAATARTLFEDLTPEQPRPPAMPARDTGSGRPTKRERRALVEWKHHIAERDPNGE